MKITFYILILFLSNLMLYSQEDLDEYWRIRDSIFVEWKIDTLQTINKYFNDSLSFPEVSYTFYPSDSLKKQDTNYKYEYEKAILTFSYEDDTYFYLDFYYSKYINRNSIKNENGKIGVILKDIEKVDKLPQEFRISFVASMYYYPSPVLKFSFQQEFKDIKIYSKEFDFDYIEYDHLRGTIRSKKIIKSFNEELNYNLDEE